MECPTVDEMQEIKSLLENTGLRCVTAQTQIGHLKSEKKRN